MDSGSTFVHHQTLTARQLKRRAEHAARLLAIDKVARTIAEQSERLKHHDVQPAPVATHVEHEAQARLALALPCVRSLVASQPPSSLARVTRNLALHSQVAAAIIQAATASQKHTLQRGSTSLLHGLLVSWSVLARIGKSLHSQRHTFDWNPEAAVFVPSAVTDKTHHGTSSFDPADVCFTLDDGDLQSDDDVADISMTAPTPLDPAAEDSNCDFSGDEVFFEAEGTCMPVFVDISGIDLDVVSIEAFDIERIYDFGPAFDSVHTCTKDSAIGARPRPTPEPSVFVRFTILSIVSLTALVFSEIFSFAKWLWLCAINIAACITNGLYGFAQFSIFKAHGYSIQFAHSCKTECRLFYRCRLVMGRILCFWYQQYFCAFCVVGNFTWAIYGVVACATQWSLWKTAGFATTAFSITCQAFYVTLAVLTKTIKVSFVLAYCLAFWLCFYLRVEAALIHLSPWISSTIATASNFLQGLNADHAVCSALTISAVIILCLQRAQRVPEGLLDESEGVLRGGGMVMNAKIRNQYKRAGHAHPLRDGATFSVVRVL